MKVSHSSLEYFAESVLTASGADANEASVIAKILVWCDLIGRDNQGVWRLPILSQRLETGLFNSPCKETLHQTSPATALIDGHQGMGHYLAYRGMQQAIQLASKQGIALVGVRDSNFFGAGAYYIQQAAEAGMIGIAASNSFPKVAAYQGISAVLGTNPFAFSAPRQNGHHLLLDMATSASAGSTIRKYIEKNETLPAGIAVDARGCDIVDPSEVENGTILPFGGAKGYGLSLMVEILSGILTGAGFSHGVKSLYKDFAESGNNGHCFVAIDIKKLLPLELYYERIESFIQLLRLSGAQKGKSRVLLPGEVRWKQYEKQVSDGVELNDKTVGELKKLADRYQLERTLFSATNGVTAPDGN